jgi:hypothetical protein
MSDEVPLRMRGETPRAFSISMELYLNKKREERADFEQRIADTIPDPDLMDGEEPLVLQNPLYDRFSQLREEFHSLTGFRARSLMNCIVSWRT